MIILPKHSVNNSSSCCNNNLVNATTNELLATTVPLSNNTKRLSFIDRGKVWVREKKISQCFHE